MRKNIAGFMLLLFGAAGWTPLGRELLKTLVWDRVIHLVSPILQIPLSVVLDYGLPIGAISYGLYLLAGPQRRHSLVDWARTKLNIYLAIAAIGATISVAALIGYAIDRSRGPIVWGEHNIGSTWRQDGGVYVANFVGAVARLVGIEGGVVSGVMNLESSGVRASDWRPRHDKCYHEA